ncbi:hypothetical protein WKK05_29340 [Nostoc sp. UHCC 0302]
MTSNSVWRSHSLHTQAVNSALHLGCVGAARTSTKLSDHRRHRSN